MANLDDVIKRAIDVAFVATEKGTAKKLDLELRHFVNEREIAAGHWPVATALEESLWKRRRIWRT